MYGDAARETQKALAEAIKKDDPITVEKLVKDAGKTLKTYRNSYQGTLLHDAAELGSVEMTKYFIKAGIDLEETDLGDGTALIRANGNDNRETQVEIVKLLLEAGANAKAMAENRSGISFFLDGNHRESAALLIKHGADVNELENGKHYHGFHMLHIAAARHNEENILFLLEHGANPRINSHANRSVLQFAIQGRGDPMNYDHIPSALVLRKLLEAGADPNAKMNKGGTTVFHKILQHANEDIVRLFIRHGARVGTMYKGKTVLKCAAKNKNGNVLRLIQALQSGTMPDV